MERRKFLLGAGSAGIGGSALVGSGAFTRVESQRQVTIDVATDPDAYLGLDECPNSPNNDFADLDGDGHLEIEMAPDNPTTEDGEGVNSDSLTHFDDVFQICNQGKDGVCVWIDAELLEVDTSLPVVDFYVLDGDGEARSILGVEQAVNLSVGECLCVGIRTYTKMLSAGDSLVKDDEIVVNADAGLDCPTVEEPPEEEPSNGQAISWLAFCQGGVTADDISLTIEETNADGEPTMVSWSSSESITTSVVFGAARLFNRDGGTSGTAVLDGDEVEWGRRTEQRPPSPCPDGQCGPKFDYKSETGTFEPVDHQDECSTDD